MRVKKLYIRTLNDKFKFLDAEIEKTDDLLIVKSGENVLEIERDKIVYHVFEEFE